MVLNGTAVLGRWGSRTVGTALLSLRTVRFKVVLFGTAVLDAGGSRMPCPEILLIAPSTFAVLKGQRGLVVHPPEMLLCSSVGEAWCAAKNNLIILIVSIAAVKGLTYRTATVESWASHFAAVCNRTQRSSTTLPSFGNGMERGGGGPSFEVRVQPQTRKKVDVTIWVAECIRGLSLMV